MLVVPAKAPFVHAQSIIETPPAASPAAVGGHRALGRGEVESNAVMRGLAGHSAAFTLVKMGGAASTIYLVGRVRRRSRTKATLLMIGLESAYGIVVAKNCHR
jgi:hypothetical protein